MVRAVLVYTTFPPLVEAEARPGLSLGSGARRDFARCKRGPAWAGQPGVSPTFFAVRPAQ